jgi:mannose-6-phosphate isomerase-like protein (cupin superfamily)
MEIVKLEEFKEFKRNSVKKEIPILTEGVMATLLLIDKDSNTLGLNNPHHDKIYYVIEGSGVVTIGDNSKKVNKGNLILVPNGHHHKYVTTTKRLVLLTIEELHKKMPIMEKTRESNEAWDKNE